MPLVEPTISKEIVNFITAGQDDSLDAESKKKVKAFGDSLAKVIVNAIRSATVTVNPGIPVATAGTPAAQTGATTGPGTGSLS